MTLVLFNGPYQVKVIPPITGLQVDLQYSFHVQECQQTTSWGYAAESARETLQRDTFEVGSALLTAMSSMRTRLVCHTHTTLCVQCAYGLDSEFTKIIFKEIFKNCHLQKIQTLENLVLYGITCLPISAVKQACFQAFPASSSILYCRKC